MSYFNTRGILCFFLLFLINTNINANTNVAKYKVEVGGVNIGELVWEINIDDKQYLTKIDLIDKGIFSGLYKFKGKYSASGSIKKNYLESSNYFQDWQTRKKNKKIEIFFYNGEVKKLFQDPKEEEFSRINLKAINGYNDPISSLINIVLGKKDSLTIDGRRVYKMRVEKINDNNLKIKIENYKNIWADHKKNNLENIEVVKSQNLLPLIIKIKFKGLVFKLSKI
tara:strand:- start:1210 stop:1884 length:675 start_codon:yes stop_codon:yes gene_type:complete